MANGIRTGDPRGFNKGRNSKFREGSRVRQTPEEGRRTYRPKCCGNNNKDEDNSPKTLNDKNHQALSEKFRQPYHLTFCCQSITMTTFFRLVLASLNKCWSIYKCSFVPLVLLQDSFFFFFRKKSLAYKRELDFFLCVVRLF